MTERPGFSLIEMVVALGVFSLAALALLNLMGEGVRSALRAETRAFGAVVAENVAVEAVVSREPPSPGTRDGQVQLAGRDWRWTRTVTATQDPGILRIDVSVTDGGEHAADLAVFRSVQ
jgi:general secretion pathway protein I